MAGITTREIDNALLWLKASRSMGSQEAKLLLGYISELETENSDLKADRLARMTERERVQESLSTEGWVEPD